MDDKEKYKVYELDKRIKQNYAEIKENVEDLKKVVDKANKEIKNDE